MHVYQLLADLVLILHFSIAAFIVAGLMLIIIGGFRRWIWVRNPRFRLTHLGAVGVVVLQAWLGQMCPLTLLENKLRTLAGEAEYPGDFIAYWLGQLLYYDWQASVFIGIYTLFALLVLIAWYWVRPGYAR